MPVIDRDRWSVLEPLLDEALELSSDEQAKWLERLRTSSPDIAADIDALLSGEVIADRRGFLAGRVEPSLAGLALGPWTLERPLGEGGMGSVWLARRTDGRFEGRAAVKFLNLALLGPTGQERFRREGSALARLAHPGIARLYDAGVAPGGQPYLVLEYVDGEAIDAYVARRARSREEIVQLVVQVLDAVGHAHANLVVHRDLKPSNILVTTDGTVKLLDFGIAKLLDRESDGSVRATLTVDGARALTPHFAAPEQARAGTITTATDVYAAGVLLYLLISGLHPTGEGCRTPVDAIRALLEVEPKRLGIGDLDTILSRALRKDPAERYQTAAALADDLRRWLRDEPPSVRPDSLLHRGRAFVRRHRVGVSVASTVAAALVAATAFSVAQMREAERQRDLALEARRHAEAQVEFQSLLMSQIGEEPLTMREIVDRSRQVLEREYAGDSRVVPALLLQLSKQYALLGDLPAREAVIARAESIAVATGGDLAEIRCHQADQQRLRGRYDDARATWEAVRASFAVRPDPLAEAGCLLMQAYFENEVGRPDAAALALERVLHLGDSAGLGGPTVEDVLDPLASSYHKQGRHRDALATTRAAISRLEAAGRGGTATQGVLTHNLGVLYWHLGEAVEAERLLHDVIRKLSLGDTAAVLPQQPLVHYGHAALARGRADSARKYFARLADQAAREGNQYWEGRGLFGQAIAEVQLGLVDDARRTAARFDRLKDLKNLIQVDDQITDHRVIAAWISLATGDTVGAHGLVVEALRAHGYFDGRRRRVLRAPLVLAAETALWTGDPRTAAGLAADARKIATMDALATSRSGYVGEARLIEARAARAMGDTAGARPAIELALRALRHGLGDDHRRTREASALLAALGR